MIVAGMDHVEVMHDAMRDLPAVERKFQRAKELLRRKHLKGDRKAVLTEIHAYPAPSGNNWYVVLRYCKVGIQTFHYCWYHGTDGRMRAVYVRPDGATAFHYSKHVWDRYSERFSPDVTGKDRMRQFFLENHMFSAHTVDLMADEVEDIVSVNQGWLFGVRDEEENLTHLTTFVDQGHFFPEQQRMEERLEFERLLGGMSLGQRTELLKKMKAADAPDEARKVA